MDFKWHTKNSNCAVRDIIGKCTRLTIEIAFSTSSLFRPANRPLKASLRRKNKGAQATSINSRVYHETQQFRYLKCSTLTSTDKHFMEPQMHHIKPCIYFYEKITSTELKEEPYEVNILMENSLGCGSSNNKGRVIKSCKPRQKNGKGLSSTHLAGLMQQFYSSRFLNLLQEFL